VRSKPLKKDLPAALAAIARERDIDPADIEVWFGDEARIGQKNKITRRWSLRGTRPAAPHDQRTASTYIFGAICPKEGKAAGLILPWCNTEAMNLHLAVISAEVAPGRHAALLLDQAGWHLSAQLVVPDNITIVPLPAKCPELNPQENIWQFMRDNWLSNRIFTGYDNLVDHCCEAWNKLVAQPWTILQEPLSASPLALLRMRRADVRELLENVGVRFKAVGGNFALREERETVIDHIVGENAAVGVLRRPRRIVAQRVGQDAVLIDRGDCFFARVVARMPHQVDELIEPALAIVNRFARVVFQFGLVGVEKAAHTRVPGTVDVK